MGRVKVELNLITNQSQRNSTYQKEKQELKKKAHELSALCNIPVLAVSIDPSTGEIYSFSSQEATDILEIYLKSNQKTQENNRFDLPTFLKDEIRKMESELKNARVEELQLLDSKISSVNERVQSFDEEKRERIAFWQDLLQESSRQQDYPPKIFSTSIAEYNNVALTDYGLNTFALNPSDNYGNLGEFDDLGLDYTQNHPSSSTMNPPEKLIGVSDTNLWMGNAEGGANYNNFDDLGFGLMQNHPLASADGFNTFAMNPPENSIGVSDSIFWMGNSETLLEFSGDGLHTFAMDPPENSSRVSDSRILMEDGDGEANYSKFERVWGLGSRFRAESSNLRC